MLVVPRKTAGRNQYQRADLRVGIEEWQVSNYSITPEQFGVERSPLKAIRVDSVEESLKMVRSLANEEGPANDIARPSAASMRPTSPNPSDKVQRAGRHSLTVQLLMYSHGSPLSTQLGASNA